MPHTPEMAKHASQRPVPWRMTMITLFPELFPGPLGASLTGQALAAGLWSLDTVNIRDFGIGRHRNVDDTPTGGGAGMVMRADVIAACIDHARTTSPDTELIYLSPRGEPFTQAHAARLASATGVIMLAGRFEGVDERVIVSRQLREISIGDYVLSGGELAAMVIADACLRLIPGVLGAAGSLAEESFENGLLEYPHYTKPRDFEGNVIPDVLLSGDHARIVAWRHAQSVSLTTARRPDLMPTTKK